jgi:antagonist of KipI
MDGYANLVANALVGNDLREGVIEIHFPAGEFLFDEDALISITGADFDPQINNRPVSTWKVIAVKKGSILSFRNKRKGHRCYLSIHGGLNLTPWLKSVSTNLKISSGGFNGRALKKGDIIGSRPSRYRMNESVFKDKEFHELPWSVNPLEVYSEPHQISFTEGREWSWLTEQSRQQILTTSFKIDASSDRMAFHVQHEILQYQYKEELLSSAVYAGTIQGLPNGKLIVLMADHQTTGGYPRVGHVISAHLPKLSQLGAHDQLYLKKITVAAAEKMLFSLMNDVNSLQQTCLEKLNQYHAIH